MSQRGTGTRATSGMHVPESPEQAEVLWWGGELPDPDGTVLPRRRATRPADTTAAVRPRDGRLPQPSTPSDTELVGAPIQEGSLLDATAFTTEEMMRPADPVPQRGWRRTVYRLSGGNVNLGPSPREQAHAALVARARMPIQGSRRIAVISRKGGVGKTTTTLMLGHTFATWRGDRVVALDGNPDAGSLGYRVRRETSATVTDLLHDAQSISRYSDIRAYTSQAPSRLEVIASDDDDAITSAIGEDELAGAVRLMEAHYNLILLDTGTGILDSATQGILRMADQIVIVAVPSIDAARAASLTLDWLEHNGYGWLVRGAVAALNQTREGMLVNIDRIREHFERRCRAFVLMPWDACLEAGAESDLAEVSEPTREAYLQLAAAVADGFTERPQHLLH
jgi:putative peptide zinc metalloprotease protein